MKLLIASLILALGTRTMAHAPWVQETAGELAVAADWNNDGSTDLLVVDRATGLLRAGLQTTGGGLVWSGPQAGGPGNITAIGFGAFPGSGVAALAVTSPAFNQLNLIRHGAAIPEPQFVHGIGPRAMAVSPLGSTGASSHVYVATGDNGFPTPHRLENLQPTPHLTDTTAALARGQSLGSLGDIAFLARAAGPAGETDALFLYPHGDLSTPLIAEGLPPGADWAWGVFGPAIESFLFWKTGSPVLRHQQRSFDVTGPAFLPAVDFPMGDPIDSVTVLTGSDASRLLIVFHEGTQAAVFSFDGVLPPVLLHSFTPAEGSRFRTVLPLGNFDFALFSGPSAGTTSNTAQRHRLQPDGTYAAEDPSPLPALPLPGASRTNVLLFSGEPFVSPTAQCLAALHARDWSVSAGGLPGSLQVQAETFQGPSSGLGSRQNVDLGAVFVPATYALSNQYAGDLSISTPAPATGTPVLTVHLTPPPGAYDQPLSVLATRSPAEAELYYRRTAGGAWSLLDRASPAALRFESDGFIEIHARRGFARSPIVGGNYLIGPIALQPIGGSGISDALWEYFGKPPLHEDPDQDNITTGDELRQGTDPFFPDANGSGAISLRITSVDLTTATLHFRLNGQPGFRYAVESSSTLAPGSWSEHLNEFTMPASGFLNFTATSTPGQRRFFRGRAR